MEHSAWGNVIVKHPLNNYFIISKYIVYHMNGINRLSKTMPIYLAIKFHRNPVSYCKVKLWFSENNNIAMGQNPYIIKTSASWIYTFCVQENGIWWKTVNKHFNCLLCFKIIRIIFTVTQPAYLVVGKKAFEISYQHDQLPCIQLSL